MWSQKPLCLATLENVFSSDNRYSKTLGIRELQIIQKVTYYYRPIRRAEIQKWQYQLLVRIWNDRNSRPLLVRMQNDTATLGDSLAISYIAKLSLTIWSSKHSSRYLSNWYENLCPQKLHRKVYGSFIHHPPKLEATKMPFNTWTGKQTVAHPYNGTLLSIQKKWATKLWQEMKET